MFLQRENNCLNNVFGGHFSDVESFINTWVFIYSKVKQNKNKNKNKILSKLQ